MVLGKDRGLGPRSREQNGHGWKGQFFHSTSREERMDISGVACFEPGEKKIDSRTAVGANI